MAESDLVEGQDVEGSLSAVYRVNRQRFFLRKTGDVSVPVEWFSQANEAQVYVSMSHARKAMHLFTDSKVALRGAVTRKSARLSP